MSQGTRFLWALLIWEAIVIVPTAIVGLSFGARIRLEDLDILAVIALVGVLVVTICAAIASKMGQAVSGTLGAVAGIACPVAVGLIWGSSSIGFEVSAAVFTSSLLFSIPSAVGGGIAGWYLSRRKVDDAPSSVPRI